MAERTLTVLLVGADVDQWTLGDLGPDVHVTTTASATAARAYLSGSAFDAVFVQEGTGGTDGLRALRDVLGLSTPVKPVRTRDEIAQWVGAQRRGAHDRLTDEQRATLEDLKREMGRVAHSLNNPLSVIMGNAQLGIELSTATGTDENVVSALQSIYEAGGELGALFGEVAALRARIDRLLAE